MNYNQKKLVVSTIKKKRCKYCLSEENLTYDHKNPLSRGGSQSIANIQVLCKVCNETKSSLSNGEVWRYAQWIWKINQSRASKGKRPLAISKKTYEASQGT